MSSRSIVRFGLLRIEKWLVFRYAFSLAQLLLFLVPLCMCLRYSFRKNGHLVAYSTAYPASVAVLYAANMLSLYYDTLIIFIRIPQVNFHENVV